MSVPGMTGGEQKSLVKYNAKTAKWHVDDKVVDKITLLMDLEHAKAGWVRFSEGVAPDFRLVPMASLVAGGQYPPQPADVDSKGKPLFRRGFVMQVKVSDQMAAGKPTVREFASGSLATVRAVDRVHTDWVAGRQDGKVPVIMVDGYKESPGQFGANYEPVFKILKWIDRPSDLQPDDRQPSQVQAQEPPAHVTDPVGEPESFDEESEEESPW